MRGWRKTGADALLADYQRGPFPTAPVADAPPALFDLLEIETGRKWTPAEVAAFERVRAFLGYEGVVLDDRLAVAQHLQDQHPERAAEGLVPVVDRRPTPARGAGAPAKPNPPTGFDPTDLGD